MNNVQIYCKYLMIVMSAEYKVFSHHEFILNLNLKIHVKIMKTST